MHRKKGDFDMYTVRFQLELSGSEKRGAINLDGVR